MTTFLTFLGLLFLLLIFKFIRDNYVTKETDEWWEKHKKEKPSEARQIEKNTGLDLRTNQKVNPTVSNDHHSDMFVTPRWKVEQDLSNEEKTPMPKEYKLGVNGIYASHLTFKDIQGNIEETTLFLQFNEKGTVLKRNVPGHLPITNELISELVEENKDQEGFGLHKTHYYLEDGNQIDFGFILPYEGVTMFFEGENKGLVLTLSFGTKTKDAHTNQSKIDFKFTDIDFYYHPNS